MLSYEENLTLVSMVQLMVLIIEKENNLFPTMDALEVGWSSLEAGPSVGGASHSLASQ